MYSLIRFFNEKRHVEEFLNGDLFMHSIGHFLKISKEVQNDFAEGVGEALSTDEFAAHFGYDLQSGFGNHILSPIQVRLETYKYVHLLCCMMHEYDLENREVMRIDPKMKAMGSYAVRINDVQAFVDLLFDKLVDNHQFGLMGPMNYHSPEEKCWYRDCFDKNNRYAHEREWRFAVIPDFNKAKELSANDNDGTAVYDEHVYFRVGSIRSIAEEIDVDELLGDAGKLYADDKGAFKTVDTMTIPADLRKSQLERMRDEVGAPIPYDAYPWQYVGWAPREAFRNKVLELGGGIKPIFAIGG